MKLRHGKQYVFELRFDLDSGEYVEIINGVVLSIKEEDVLIKQCINVYEVLIYSAEPIFVERLFPERLLRLHSGSKVIFDS